MTSRKVLEVNPPTRESDKVDSQVLLGSGRGLMAPSDDDTVKLDVSEATEVRWWSR